jgi:hypothetical protein
VVTKKVTKPLARPEQRGRASALNAPRRRVHALAPEHVGELGSVAALAVAVLGLAIVVLALAIIVSGLTMGSRYDSGGGLPPNIGQLGQAPLLGGIGLAVLGMLLVAAPLGLLVGLPGTRLATILLSLLTGVLSVGGVLLVIARPASDPVLVATLGITALLFGASALLLARPGR